MKFLIVTIVHHPDDARISQRQIPALVAAGHEVTYAAPFTECGIAPPPNVRAVDMPRAVGRRRSHAWLATRRLLSERGPDFDLVLVHDLEVAQIASTVPPRLKVAWDVHEDTPAAVDLKSWIPRPLHGPARSLARRAEARVASRMPVMLAEAAYRDRFLGSPPVVPNTTPVPDAARPSLPGRVVYLGSLSLARGVAEMIELASRIRPEIEVHLIGPADQQSTALLRAAVADGILVWKGPIRNRAALQSISGATAGLALLHDHANYRHSLPTKVIEYMAYGVPAITTPLPIARDIVCKYECGEVVPFASVDDVVHAVRRLNDEDLVRRRMGERGHAAALQHFNWNRDAPRFVRTMEKFATEQAAPI